MKLTLDKYWAKVREAHAELTEAEADYEARAKWIKAYDKWTEAKIEFAKTVRTVCGPYASIEWTDTGCIVLGVMEFLYPQNT